MEQLTPVEEMPGSFGEAKKQTVRVGGHRVLGGEACGGVNNPGVYTDVYSLRDFIVNNTFW